MIDNKPLELQAETYVLFHLLKYGIKTSKPAFDQDGADLLIVDSIKRRTTSFLKVQCKLRSYAKGKSNHVSIPIKYVTDNFILFLYTIDEAKVDHLFVFFCDEIREWKILGEEYYLGVSEHSLRTLVSCRFDENKARRIQDQLKKAPIKKYTTLVIDGIFLELAIKTSKSVYEKIWSDKTFSHPKLEDVVNEILAYNQFSNVEPIQCILFLSTDFSLEEVIQLPDVRVFNEGFQEVRLTIEKTNRIISFCILEYLERVINTENIILVANDRAYEKPLQDLKDEGTDVIIVKLPTDLGGDIFTKHRWGDICYPLGIALGLERHEL